MPADIPMFLPPLIKFIAASVICATSLEIAARYRLVLHTEFSCGVVTALDADYYWADRVRKVSPNLMKAMEQWSSEDFDDIPVGDNPDASVLVLDGLIAHSRSVRTAAENRLYSRPDYARDEQLVWAFKYEKGGLAKATLYGCSHHGLPVSVPFGSQSKKENRCSGNPESDWWVALDASLDPKIHMRELMRGSRGRIQGILGPLVHKARIIVRELVEKIIAFCGRGGRVGMDPEFSDGHSGILEEDVADERALRRKVEEDLHVTRDEIQVTHEDLGKWKNSYLNLADGFSGRTQSLDKRCR